MFQGTIEHASFFLIAMETQQSDDALSRYVDSRTRGIINKKSFIS